MHPPQLARRINPKEKNHWNPEPQECIHISSPSVSIDIIVTDSFIIDKYNCQKNNYYCHKDLYPLQNKKDQD